MLPTIKTVFWIPVYTCWAAISGNNLWHDNYVQMNYDKRPKNECLSLKCRVVRQSFSVEGPRNLHSFLSYEKSMALVFYFYEACFTVLKKTKNKVKQRHLEAVPITRLFRLYSAFDNDRTYVVEKDLGEKFQELENNSNRSLKF